MRDRFSADGEVRFLGAEIGGNFDCTNGTFNNGNGDAISADGLKLAGTVFFTNNFRSTGQIRLLSAEIGGNLACHGGILANNNRGGVLNADGSRISGSLFLRDAKLTGEINLTAAFADSLVDNEACYQEVTLILDGFRYDRIVGPTAAMMRIGWLNRQRQDQTHEDFKPQPWEHLIRVLREMGHPADAAQIAIAKQEALRHAKQIGMRRPNPTFCGWRLALDKGWSAFSNHLARRLHWFYGWIAGYGHRPTRIAWRMFTVCALCSLAYYGGREFGLIGPSAPVLQMHPALIHCGTAWDAGAAYWTSTGCPMPPEYSTLQPFIYSLDVIIPFVDLHQESEWGPVVTNVTGEPLFWGRVLRGILWFEIIFGWIASVMFVAIIGRLVDKD